MESKVIARVEKFSGSFPDFSISLRLRFTKSSVESMLLPISLLLVMFLSVNL